MPVPPLTSDMLATISMFENVKVEPMSFYSTCPPPTLANAQINTQDQQTNVLQQQQQQHNPQNQQQRNDNTHHSTVITTNDDKDNMQGNVVRLYESFYKFTIFLLYLMFNMLYLFSFVSFLFLTSLFLNFTLFNLPFLVPLSAIRYFVIKHSRSHQTRTDSEYRTISTAS